jgi:hypothetical protein
MEPLPPAPATIVGAAGADGPALVRIWKLEVLRAETGPSR